MQSGFRVKRMPHVTQKHHLFAGTDAERLSDLQAAWCDREVKAVWCVRGGYGAMRLLGTPDLFPASCPAKWLIGFSDITVLHARLQHDRGIVSVHGPMMKHLAENGEEHPDVRHTLQLIQGQKHTAAGAFHALQRNGTATGQLVGGNLSMVFALRETPWAFHPQGKILFLEDLSEYHYHLDRMMQSLKWSGVLEQLSGIVVGQFTDMKDGASPFGANSLEIIQESVAAYHYPVVMNFPSGHSESNHPLLLGAEVHLEVDSMGWQMKYTG